MIASLRTAGSHRPRDLNGPRSAGAKRPTRAAAPSWLVGLALTVSILTGLGTGPARASVEPMSFQIVPLGAVNGVCGRTCTEIISANGEITNDTADQLVQFLTQNAGNNGITPVILLESPGGTVIGAMQLGMVFRKIGAAVIVGEPVGDAQIHKVGIGPGYCMSACAYAFFGGKKRVVLNNSKLGIHRMVINEAIYDPAKGMVQQQVFGTDEIVSSLAGYTRSMGVDPSVIAFAEQVPPELIHVLSAKEIARWHIGSRHF